MVDSNIGKKDFKNLYPIDSVDLSNQPKKIWCKK